MNELRSFGCTTCEYLLRCQFQICFLSVTMTPRKKRPSGRIQHYNNYLLAGAFSSQASSLLHFENRSSLTMVALMRVAAVSLILGEDRCDQWVCPSYRFLQGLPWSQVSESPCRGYRVNIPKYFRSKHAVTCLDIWSTFRQC